MVRLFVRNKGKESRPYEEKGMLPLPKSGLCIPAYASSHDLA
jgi:hypothetical protein